MHLLRLGLAQDGMDQSKWRIPRYDGQRPLKSTMNLQRPQLKIQGIWIFNVTLDLWVPWLPSKRRSQFWFID